MQSVSISWQLPHYPLDLAPEISSGSFALDLSPLSVQNLQNLLDIFESLSFLSNTYGYMATLIL